MRGWWPMMSLAACVQAPTEQPTATPPVVDEEPLAVDRLAFNQAAARLALPLFRKADGTVVRYASPLPMSASLSEATAAIEAEARSPRAPASPAAAAIRAELDRGRPTLLETDLRALSDADERFIRRMMEVGVLVERLHARQRGVPDPGVLLAVDAAPALRMLAYRNQGPWCLVEDCGTEPAPSGLYPARVQRDPGFCDTLARDHPEVMQPFVVAADDGAGGLTAVPYHLHDQAESVQIAEGLREAAGLLDPQAEAAQRAYLNAAAHAFVTGDWFAADAAWAKVDQNNSAWYLRVGPDEVYFDPCGVHAGYHVQIARVSSDSLAWQRRLDPVKQKMEAALAAVAGPPYVQRTVGFDLPEFIEVVINYGDARSPLGATVGQSLPNWGPVSEAGGRTVAMTNIGGDPDSRAAAERSMDAVFCADTRPSWTSDPKPQLASTILHEASHNLGPAGEYVVDGKTDTQIFGGALATMMEELKAQTGALYLSQWLVDEGHEPASDLFRVQLGDVGWAFGQVSSGFVDQSGRPQVYPQLAAVQLGILMDEGALTWRATEAAANGVDVGCFSASKEKMRPAIDAMATRVLQIKARGDVTAARALRDHYTAPDSLYQPHWEVLVERMRREPDASFVYRPVVD